MDVKLFNGMFGKLAPGMCRLSMSGGIAVKTSNGYKTYNVATGRLTNCAQFVLDIGEDFFFVMPTNKVKVGDIILVDGPRCVIEVGDKNITVLNYENSTVETIVPERHMFMGNAYFYGKIVSMFGNSFKKNKKAGMGNMFKYMMISEMFKGNNTATEGYGGSSASGGGMLNGMSAMLPFMMMGGNGFDTMFDDMFDFDSDDDSEEDLTEEDE